MRITKLEITDFRGVDSLALDMSGPGNKPLDLVVLAGPNGCGKTSILEACLRAFHRDDLVPKGRSLKDETRYGTSNFSVRVTVDVNGTKAVVRRSPNSADLLNEARWTSPRTGEIEDFSNIAYYSSWRYPKLVGNVSVTAAKKGKRPSDTEDNRLWRLKQYLVNLTAMKGFEEAGRPSLVREAPEDAFARLNRLWKLFYPEREERFVAKPASDDVEAGFDVYLERKRTQVIPMDLLSSGEIEVLCLLGLGAAKKDRPDILFIDEPELHLHSAWHRIVLRALRAVLPTTQIVCATHSAEILDSVYSYERFTILPADDPRIRLVDAKVRKAL